MLVLFGYRQTETLPGHTLSYQLKASATSCAEPGNRLETHCLPLAIEVVSIQFLFRLYSSTLENHTFHKHIKEKKLKWLTKY